MSDAAYRKPGTQITPLSRETLQDQVYRQLCALILEGAIVPGEMVTVQSLADAFGVSPMPVREALRRLMAANAVTVVSGRSIGIPKLTLARLTDLYKVRSAVETVAGAWAAALVTEPQLAELRSLLEELEQADASGDIKAYLHANHAFHFGIYRAAGSPSMIAIIENLWLQISPYFNMLRDSGNYATANREHRAMIEGLERRDANAVRDALHNDIDAAYLVLRELVPR